MVVVGSTLDKWHSLVRKYNRIGTTQDIHCSAVLIILQCCGCGKITHWSISFGEHQNLVCALIEPQQVARASVSIMCHNVEMVKSSTHSDHSDQSACYLCCGTSDLRAAAHCVVCVGCSGPVKF